MTHKKRVAKLAHRLTGMGHSAARQLAHAGIIRQDRPIPDAATPQQRAFETRLMYALINAFPDRQQPTGFPWAIAAAIPTEHGLDLYPAPHTADRLLGALLPRYDHNYGGVLGVAGARATIAGSTWWTLHDLDSDAQVRVAATATCDPDRGRHWAAGDQTSVIDAARLTPHERSAQRHPVRLAQHKPPGWLHHRDVLGSRLLRRPGLTRWLARTHGCVNIYTHAELDVVIEWCCGPSVPDMIRDVLRAGLTSSIPEVDLSASGVTGPHDQSPTATVGVGHAHLYLRRNPWLHGGFEGEPM